MSIRAYPNDPRINTEPDGSYSIIDQTGSSYWHVLGDDASGWAGVDSVSACGPEYGATADEVIGKILRDLEA